MHESVRTFVRHAIAEHELGDGAHVLEVGSADVNGGIIDLLPDGVEYIGVDLADGPGVTLVCDAHHLEATEVHLTPASFDLVLCLEMLEHDAAPWVTVGQLAAMVKPTGMVLISARGNGFPEHNPPDCWRFMEDGIMALCAAGGLIVDRLDPDPQVSGWFAQCTRAHEDTKGKAVKPRARGKAAR